MSTILRFKGTNGLFGWRAAENLMEVLWVGRRKSEEEEEMQMARVQIQLLVCESFSMETSEEQIFYLELISHNL